MGAAGISIRDTFNTNKNSRKSGLIQGLLFVAPSIVITAVSYLLFALLQNITPSELRALSITIMTGVLVSLIGTAPVQLLIYRIVDEGKYAGKTAPAMQRGVRVGILYSLAFTTLAAILLYPLYISIFRFSAWDYFYFVALVVIYSLIWILTTTFWAAGDYKNPAIVFIFGYIVLFFLTYAFYELNPGAAMSGYLSGASVILLLATVALDRVLRQPVHVEPFDFAQGKSVPGEPVPEIEASPSVAAAAGSPIPVLLRRNLAAVFFQVFYVLAIFLDKVSVWVVQGIRTGGGLDLTGAYTVASFLGVIPLFAVATIAYFNAAASPITANLYKGTLAEIKARANAYRRVYRKSLVTLMLTSLILITLTTVFTWIFVADPNVLGIEITIGIGCFFFLIIILDSSVLPLFGEIRISTLSVFTVCLAELVAAFFVSQDIWYAAAGFAFGSFLGFLLSEITLLRLFAKFEYLMFRQIVKSFVG